MSSKTSDIYIHDKDVDWEDLGEGIHRKLLTYEGHIMMAKIAFKAGAVGPPHSHPHIQCSYVESGEFKLTIDGRSETLTAGDSFLVPPDKMHDAVALTDGVLIDVFTPMRKDFLA